MSGTFDFDSFHKYFVYLQITSWAGVSIGAEHSYGELCGYNGKEDQTIELKKALTREDARLLNKKDSTYGRLWKEGELTKRFNTEEEIIKIAKKEWKKHFPQAKVLIEGRSGILEPQLIIVAPADYKRKCNILFQKVEANNGWEGDEKVMQAIEDEWKELNKEYFKIWKNK